MDYTQFAGKPFEVISKLGVRYTGIFDSISQEDQTVCLSQVYNHGTEDRPTQRKLPGSTSTLGWVRFHTESIESLRMIEDHRPAGAVEEPVDPILASVSSTGPAPAAQPDQSAPVATSHPLPPKPAGANTAYPQTHPHPRRQSRPKAPEVPDAEFDFSKGTSALQADRDARNVVSPPAGQADLELGNLDYAPHPIAVQAANSSNHANDNANVNANANVPKAQPAYNKDSFWDNLTVDSARVSRAEERGRNYDTFGEAGGAGNGQRGGRGGGRGGYGYGNGQRRYGGEGNEGYGNGYNNNNGYGGRGRGRGGYGYRGRGGYSSAEQA